jgi:hypothetical protein
MEVFSFEGHTTEVTLTGKRVIAQLLAIDEDRNLPQALRQPAANLLRNPSAGEEGRGKRIQHPQEPEVAQRVDCHPLGVHSSYGQGPAPGGKPFEVEDRTPGAMPWHKACQRPAP